MASLSSSASSMATAAAPSSAAAEASLPSFLTDSRRRPIRFSKETPHSVKTVFGEQDLLFRILSFLGKVEHLKDRPIQFSKEAPRSVKRVFHTADLILTILSFLGSPKEMNSAGLVLRILDTKEILKVALSARKRIFPSRLFKIFGEDTQALEEFFKNCKQLEFLNPSTSGNELARIPSSIITLPNFKGLEFLQPKQYDITAGDIIAFAERVPFKEMRVKSVNYSVPLRSDEIARLTRLTALTFWETPHNHDHLAGRQYLEAIASLPHLTELDAGVCDSRRVEEFFACFANNQTLKKLRLRHALFGDGLLPVQQYVEGLSQMPFVKVLDLSHCLSIRDTQVPELGKLNFIETIDLSGCFTISPQALIELLKKREGPLHTLILKPFTEDLRDRDGDRSPSLSLKSSVKGLRIRVCKGPSLFFSNSIRA